MGLTHFLLYAENHSPSEWFSIDKKRSTDPAAFVLGRSAKATRNKRAALNCENCSICVLFRIILRLCVPKSVVFAAPIGEQFVMAALLDDLSFVKHGNLVTEFTGGQPVGDIDRGLIACDLIELIVAEKSSLFQ